MKMKVKNLTRKPVSKQRNEPVRLVRMGNIVGRDGLGRGAKIAAVKIKMNSVSAMFVLAHAMMNSGQHLKRKPGQISGQTSGQTTAVLGVVQASK